MGMIMTMATPTMMMMLYCQQILFSPTRMIQRGFKSTVNSVQTSLKFASQFGALWSSQSSCASSSRFFLVFVFFFPCICISIFPCIFIYFFLSLCISIRIFPFICLTAQCTLKFTIIVRILIAAFFPCISISPCIYTLIIRSSHFLWYIYGRCAKFIMLGS